MRFAAPGTMSNSLLNIGASGLRVAELALRVTGHNVANANTPGYSRQQALQTSNLPLYAGVGYLGQGANVTTVRRIYDSFLTVQVAAGQSQTSGLDRQLQLLTSLDSVLSNSSTGLSGSLQEFFGALDGIASQPSQNAPRQTFLASTEVLANRIRSVSQRLDTLGAEVNNEIPAQVAAVNVTSKQIAMLNERIAQTEATSNGQPANDLRDQRDALVRDLNTVVRARVTETGDGQFSVYIGNGQPLVLGQKNYELKAEPSEFDSAQFSVSFDTGNGTMPLSLEQIGGGKLAGLLAFRQDTLEPARAELGRIAAVLGTAVNTQHAAGFDLDGAAGGAVFSFDSMDPPVASKRNTGSGTVGASITDMNQLSGSDYRVSFIGGQYVVKRLPDDVEVGTAAAPGTLNVDGLQLTFGGAAADGDSFLVRPAANASRNFQLELTDPRKFAAAAADPTAAGNGVLDNGNASQLAALRNATLLNGGSTSIGSAYIDLVTDVGTQTKGVELMHKAQSQLLEDGVAAQQAISGVNLDEEAANLLRFQQAYQASAKVMQTATSIFDTLLSIAN